MDVERPALHTGVDSWEGEMTYPGTAYKLEVGQRDHHGAVVWDMEVFRDRYPEMRSRLRFRATRQERATRLVGVLRPGSRGDACVRDPLDV
jgi:hypothetical protein